MEPYIYCRGDAPGIPGQSQSPSGKWNHDASMNGQSAAYPMPGSPRINQCSSLQLGRFEIIRTITVIWTLYFMVSLCFTSGPGMMPHPMHQQGGVEFLSMQPGKGPLPMPHIKPEPQDNFIPSNVAVPDDGWVDILSYKIFLLSSVNDYKDESIYHTIYYSIIFDDIIKLWHSVFLFQTCWHW